MRAQPRSAGEAGTTAPCSGHVRGRGESQCQARRTRITSPNADVATDATREIGPAEYQAMEPLLDLAEHDRRRPQVGHGRVAADRLLGHLERVLEGGRGLEAEAVHDVALATHDDDVARVLHRVRGP